MTLETMKEVTSIGDFDVTRVGSFGPQSGSVEINDDANTIAFKLQDGPVKENGINGCQVDTIIEAGMMILQGLDEKMPCMENQMAINSLENALLWLELRIDTRKRRGVEGSNRS